MVKFWKYILSDGQPVQKDMQLLLLSHNASSCYPELEQKAWFCLSVMLVSVNLVPSQVKVSLSNYIL